MPRPRNKKEVTSVHDQEKKTAKQGEGVQGIHQHPKTRDGPGKRVLAPTSPEFRETYKANNE